MPYVPPTHSNLTHRLLGPLAIAFLPLAAAAATPSQMVTNVYRLTEAAAVLDVCFASADYGRLPKERAQALRAQQKRLGGLVQAIARHYSDGGLYETFEATRAMIAAEAYMKNYGKAKYQNCSDQLAQDMERYVLENEKLINGYLSGQSGRKAAQ
jgi:hypothetical protein